LAVMVLEKAGGIHQVIAHVPHSQAYTVTKKMLYKKIVLETIAFVEQEMVDPEGGFYSTLDTEAANECCSCITKTQGDWSLTTMQHKETVHCTG